MSGASLRLGRLFDSGSGRSFIAAIDHGITLGVPTGAEDAVGAVERVVACEPDAVLISPGLLSKTGDHFARRGAPSPIVRADWFIATTDPHLAGYDEQYRVLVSPTHAAHLGADAFILFLILGPERGAQFADNVRILAQAAEDAHKVGLPLIVEAVAWGHRVPERRKDADLLAFGCRMAAELGADAVKTEWTGDVASMRQVVDGCPVPVLVLGGPKTEDPNALYDATEQAMVAGAKGVVYGRNVWQADDPVATSRRLREIIHSGPALVGS